MRLALKSSGVCRVYVFMVCFGVDNGSGLQVGHVPAVAQGHGFVFGESDELGGVERDFVGVEREQGLGGPVLKRGDDLGHGIEHALWHRPGHGCDDGAGDFHSGVIGHWLVDWLLGVSQYRCDWLVFLA